MANATEQKFQDPDNRIAQGRFWTVLLRPRQPTLGSLVLVCREDVKSFGDVSPAALAEMGVMVRNIEAMLRAVVHYERINYLMLMMVDPDVHFHVLPRYATPRDFGGMRFADSGWPGVPQLEPAVMIEPALRDQLLARLVAAWRAAGGEGA